MNYTKFIIRLVGGILFVVAGVAVAQTLNPQVPDINGLHRIVVNNTNLLNSENPIPGTVREARACSADITRLCAQKKETRRNVPDCLTDNKSSVSRSCLNYIARDAE